MVENGFQKRVDKWMDACFGEAIKADQIERADRFIEESLELVQAIPRYHADRAHALVDYVFGRPVGEQSQEVGGVRVTLAALCNAVGIDADQAGNDELDRIWTKVDAIREKQASKPTGSALPIPDARTNAIRSLPDDPAMVERVARALCAHDDAIWDATDFTQTPCGNTPEDMRAGYIDAAQAVLRAIGGVE